jgi:ubiquitin carboxyl-terminal hydrolase 1
MLDDHVKLDLIDEHVCRKCRLLATLDRLAAEVEHPTPQGAGKRALTTLKRKRRELAALRAHLAAGDLEAELAFPLDRAERPATKQSMIARPPRVLAVHLVRFSAYRSGRAVKNTCRVAAPAELELTPYTTAAALSTRPESPMGASSAVARDDARHRYRLTSVVEHFGTHSHGHDLVYTRRRAGR